MSRRLNQFNMEGQRREMSVLFADIRNFTHISESLEASELKRWLNDYHPHYQTDFCPPWHHR